jgi:hypothetical protein
VLTPRFLDVLATEKIGPRRWRLLRELRYDSAVMGARIIVPEGFETDFSSVPRGPLVWWLAGGIGDYAGVIHDFLYNHRLGGRQMADDVFLEALRVEGVEGWRAWLMHTAVRWRGGAHW